MPAFAANLTMNYPGLAFLDRFAAAAADGFAGVEFLFPYEQPAAEIRARLDAHDLVCALFNAPPGDWAAGERGIAALPGREDEFRRGIETALSYATALGNSRLHVMSGIVASDADRARHRATYVGNLAYAAAQARPHGITVLVEPINTRDMPGYLVNLQEDGAALCREAGADNLALQFDLYHAQIMQGDVSRRFEALFEQIAHVQAASVPDRHEPDSGELDFAHLFALLDRLGYRGWVGCEYRPRGDTSDGLGWLGSARGRRALAP